VAQLALLPLASFAEIDMADANRLLEEWGHYLGACRRPFGQQAFALTLGERPVAVAVSASAVNHAAGYQRNEIVELARLVRHPDIGWVSRPALRLWREIAAPAWPYWPVKAAIAYSQNMRHDGELYRWDGWTKVTDKAGSSGGGMWSRKREQGDAVYGRKTLWLWRFP
jgi:hypothetical protein